MICNKMDRGVIKDIVHELNRLLFYHDGEPIRVNNLRKYDMYGLWWTN